MSEKRKTHDISIRIKTALTVIMCCLFVMLLSAKNVYAVPAEGATVQYSGTKDTVTWEIYTDGTLVIRPTEGDEGTFPKTDFYFYAPWRNYKSMIKSVEIRETVHVQGSISNMFKDLGNCSSFDLTGLDISAATNMRQMFYQCKAAKSIEGISDWDTSNVTDMSSLFYSCNALTSLDVSGFDTSNVTDMDHMFYGCNKLTSIDVSGFDTGKVTDAEYMFCNCNALISIDVSNFDTSNVTDMGHMFYGCNTLTSIDISNFDTGNVTQMNNMFGDCEGLTSLDVSNFDTSNVITMNNMFYNCSALTSLDLSGFDTGNVTDMSFMFYNCSDLASLDLSGFDTGNVINMRAIFQNCESLTSLNLSGFDTKKVTSMIFMFSNCGSLSSVDIGENFRFKGKNITTTGYQACLPTPPSSTTTGKWIREDRTVEGKTPAELRDQYDSNAAAWAGKWVWDINTNAAVVMFDAQGGYTAHPQVNVSPITAVTVPEATRPAYALTAWTENADGTGVSYQPGSSFTPEGGKVTTLYAQWEKAAVYKVNHYQQNVSQTGYDLVETNEFYAKKDSSVSPEVKTYEGFISPSVQTVTVSADNTTVVEYRYDRTSYTIKFDGNGATSGNTEDQHMVGANTQRLHDNKFKKENHVFSGWNTKADGTGTAYGDAQTIKDLAGNGETITLYAQWIDISSAEKESSSGRYTVKIRPGETVSIPDLPAGTKYTVREIDNPDGWTQTGETGTEGTISSNKTDSASITNSYSASGKASILAYKTMEGGDAAEGEYEFQLLSGTTVLQTARNGNPDVAEEILDTDGETMVKNPYYGMNVVRFEEIEINKEGDHTFTIKEVKGDAGDVEYDEHTETVTIHAVDNGNGTLTCTTEYDSDGPVFTNRRIPSFDEPDKKGRILISKDVSNMPSSGQAFPFTLHLYDKAGTELVDDYKIDIVRSGNEDDYISSEMITDSAVSYTQNLDDQGNKQSNYGSSWTNKHIRGTGRETAINEAHVIRIPGAEELNVSIVYGGESVSYDWVCMWQGSHPEYTAQKDYSSSVTGKLGGGDHTATSNTKTYTVPGDTVTFAYRSDGGGYGDGYGYYAVVTAQVNKEEYNDKCISHETIASGGSFSLTSGQTAVVRDLPAGVTYKVEEGETSGFELVKAEGTEGALTADDDTVPDARAVFTNVYNGRGEAQIRMRKVFEKNELQAGQFSFRLLDGNGKEIETVTNDAEGNIVFSPIQFGIEDIGQRYAYSVVEVPGNDKNILYDEHTENVVIEVTDGGDGNLNANVQYKGSATFTNRPGLSSLKLKKTVRGNMGSRARMFTFIVTMTDEKDAPLTGTFEYKGASSGTITLDATGSASLQLGHGDEVTIQDVPIGTKYRIVETDYSEDGYTAESENASGVITQEAQTASFVNTRDADIGTGVDFRFRTGAAVLLISAAVAAFFIIRRKRVH